MKYLSEYRDKEICQHIIRRIKPVSTKKINLMEVCGTHTMSIARYGIRESLPDNIHLISGPGCPVCVTSQKDIDKFIELSKFSEVIICTFGDLMRVPGSDSSLMLRRAEGADVRIVYSTLDCLEIAEQNPEREVVFLGVGFETTTPTIAATIKTAGERKLKNFSVLAAHKLVPPALLALLESEELNVDGFIYPGHVSTMIGSNAYIPVLNKYKVPGVIAGFEPADILQAIYMLVKQIEEGNAGVEVAYKRSVTKTGNQKAMDLMYEVFTISDAEWRGIGTIPESGLVIRKEYEAFNAENKFHIEVKEAAEPQGCICGNILLGKNTPSECALFADVCSPENPVGPCMVSSEGTCAAYYKYYR